MQQTENSKDLTTSEILIRLQQRVSKGNAKLLLDTAKIQCGVMVEDSVVLELDQAKTLCLRLIKQGGPSFQVGQAIYKEYLM
ncbi:MAG: hypothetical protein COT73_10680 [Bdellovibrio sp. CG10_big_fil_rev_8_21_14_0_10_47_8]|nr:MAG: hypothetical protein COT73_10680 [Bdellovibrio sp. CG10_big_fil_rev_8_21_14_0_10_47_8]